MSTYTLKVAGLTRELTRYPVSDTTDIAGFIMFSDVELTVACAEALLEKCPEFDVILTAESKGIPLAYEAARQSGKNYFVARKSVKAYTPDPISVQVKSITTAAVQTLYLSKDDADRIKDKRVLLLDDVISTGESIAAIEQLAQLAGGRIAGRAAVLAEGKAVKREDIVYLEELPLFKREN